MNIAISKPVEHTKKIVTTEQLSELTIEFVTINPVDNRLILKLQPINKEITLRGSAYEAVKPQLEKALGKVLAPIIEAEINPPAAPAAEAQPETK